MTTLDRAVTGEKLRKLREERKLTQQEVADAIGVTAMAICQYETGEREHLAMLLRSHWLSSTA